MLSVPGIFSYVKFPKFGNIAWFSWFSWFSWKKKRGKPGKKSCSIRKAVMSMFGSRFKTCLGLILL